MATVKDMEKRLEELEAENRQLKEQNEKQPEALVLPDAKFTPTIPYVPKRKVLIELFKDDQRYKEPLFVGINGRFMLIQRGVQVEVDDYVADFIEQQKAEEARIMRRVELEEQEYLKNTAALI
jgi:hypothetical protein